MATVRWIVGGNERWGMVGRGWASDHPLGMADLGGAPQERRQVQMGQSFVSALETTHGLGADLVRQADEPFGGVVGRVGGIATDRSPGPLDVLQQLIRFPEHALAAVQETVHQTFSLLGPRR